MLIAIWFTILGCREISSGQYTARAQTDRHTDAHTKMCSDHLLALGLSSDHLPGCELPLVGQHEVALELQQDLQALGMGVVGGNMEGRLQEREGQWHTY